MLLFFLCSWTYRESVTPAPPFFQRTADIISTLVWYWIIYHCITQSDHIFVSIKLKSMSNVSFTFFLVETVAQDVIHYPIISQTATWGRFVLLQNNIRSLEQIDIFHKIKKKKFFKSLHCVCFILVILHDCMI